MSQRTLVLTGILVLIGIFGLAIPGCSKNLPQGESIVIPFTTPVEYIYANDIIGNEGEKEIILCSGGNLLIYNFQGKEIWGQKIEGGKCRKILVDRLVQGGIKKMLTLTDEYIYVHAADSEDGSIFMIRRCEVNNGKDFQIVNIDNNIKNKEIILASNDGIYLYQSIWGNCNYTIVAKGNFNFVDILESKKLIVGVVGNRLQTLDLSGNVKWNFTSWRDISAIKTTKNKVIVGDKGGNVYVFNENGEKENKKLLPGPIVDMFIKDPSEASYGIIIASRKIISEWIPESESYTEKSSCGGNDDILKIGQGILNGEKAIVSVHNNGNICGIDFQLKKNIFSRDVKEIDKCDMLRSVCITHLISSDPNGNILLGCNDRAINVYFKSEAIESFEAAKERLKSAIKLCRSSTQFKDYEMGLALINEVREFCDSINCKGSKEGQNIELHIERYKTICRGNMADLENAINMSVEAEQNQKNGRCLDAIEYAKKAIALYKNISDRSDNDELFKNDTDNLNKLIEECNTFLRKDKNTKNAGDMIYYNALEYFKNGDYTAAKESAEKAIEVYKKIHNIDERDKEINKCDSLIKRIDEKIKEEEFTNYIKIKLESLKLLIIVIISFLICWSVIANIKNNKLRSGLLLFGVLWAALFLIEGVIGWYNGIPLNEIMTIDFAKHTVIKDIISTTIGIGIYMLSKIKRVRKIIGIKEDLSSFANLKLSEISKFIKDPVECNSKDKIKEVIEKIEKSKQTHVVIRDYESHEIVAVGSIRDPVSDNNLYKFVKSGNETFEKFVQKQKEKNRKPVYVNMEDSLDTAIKEMECNGMHSILIKTSGGGVKILYREDAEKLKEFFNKMR